MHVIPQRTGSGAPDILCDILALADGGSNAHRAAPSEGRAISFIVWWWAAFPAKTIVLSHKVTAKTCFGVISSFNTDNVCRDVVWCNILRLTFSSLATADNNVKCYDPLWWRWRMESIRSRHAPWLLRMTTCYWASSLTCVRDRYLNKLSTPSGNGWLSFDLCVRPSFLFCSAHVVFWKPLKLPVSSTIIQIA